MIILFRSFYDFKSILKKYPRENNSNVTLAVLTSGGDSQGKSTIVKNFVVIMILPIDINSLTVIKTLYS